MWIWLGLKAVAQWSKIWVWAFPWFKCKWTYHLVTILLIWQTSLSILIIRFRLLNFICSILISRFRFLNFNYLILISRLLNFQFWLLEYDFNFRLFYLISISSLKTTVLISNILFPMLLQFLDCNFVKDWIEFDNLRLCRRPKICWYQPRNQDVASKT